jgi:L-ascorbate metabolism protein UlaG (beta-lactamase superfamily)
MSNQKLFLRDDVYFEPLFNGWYAWSYLVPPVHAARFVVNTHRRIMKSFVNNYELHISAVKESVVTGGEFLNCTADQVGVISGMIEDIDNNCRDIVQLSDAVTRLDEMLAQHTSGQSIEYLYERVPPELRGFVELVMDLHHRPTFRLIEPLLYRSKYYKPGLQKLCFGSLSKVAERPFVLSTPRLPDENHLQVNVDFSSPLADELFRARETALAASRVAEIFEGLDRTGGLSYRELFTEDRSKYRPRQVNGGVRLEYTGHAGFLVESRSCAVLIDPVIASRGAAYADGVFGFSQLPPKIDFICLTHNHQDHVCLETLLQLRYKTDRVLVPKNNGGTLADPSIRLLLKQLGFSVIEVDDLDEIPLPNGRITSIPFFGEHGDLNVRSKTAWLVEMDGRKCFFGADSANPDISLYENLREVLADLDVFAIGMECVGAPYTWLYGALHTKMVPKAIRESRRLNGSDARQALPIVKMLQPRQVFIYALGREPWYKYFMGIEYDENSLQIKECNKMSEACRDFGVSVEAMYGRKTLELT